MTPQSRRLSRHPARKLAVLACMDSRLDLFEILQLDPGDAHVIRNGGGILTDDSLRSLAMSQRLLGTQDVVVVQHTDCGMNDFDDEGFRRSIAEETGFEPPWRQPGFDDVEANVRTTVAELRDHPALRCKTVTGYVYDTDTLELREIS